MSSLNPPVPSRRGGFQKGVSGNPGGRPHVPAHFKDAFQRASPVALKALREIVADPKQAGSTRVMAASTILDRAWGKPAQSLDITKTNVLDMSDAEIIAILAASSTLPTIADEQSAILEGQAIDNTGESTTSDSPTLTSTPTPETDCDPSST